MGRVGGASLVAVTVSFLLLGVLPLLLEESFFALPLFLALRSSLGLLSSYLLVKEHTHHVEHQAVLLAGSMGAFALDDSRLERGCIGVEVSRVNASADNGKHQCGEVYFAKMMGCLLIAIPKENHLGVATRDLGETLRQLSSPALSELVIEANTVAEGVNGIQVRDVFDRILYLDVS